ncbi:peptidoglycan-binding protein [Streptomyces niveus]|uniref:peptidoglycan-binding domain-containing protein n=1 Tax=Streptomyces niveus TaxID=193462 RepID=UPI002E31F29B|nr:peptidoglycan-binding protein [Streptomyces niveus]
MTGQLCPECGTPRDAYGRPGAGCDCSERAAIAAAEDFHPLRIRPYVALKEPDGAAPSSPPPSLLPPAYDEGEGEREGDRSEGADPAETMRLSLPGLRTAAPGAAAADPERTGGRRRFARVALTAAAVVAVIGAASFAGGLFTGDGGGDEATSDLNSGLPTASARPDPSASSTRSASAPGPASPSTTGSGSAKGTGTGTASASAPKPAEDGPPSPDTGPAAPDTPSAPASASDGTRTTQGPEAGSGATLRRGDSGADVEELQRRLSEIWLYDSDYDGRFGERVEAAVRVYQSYKSIEGDPSGVYGPNTRRALEAETSGNGRDQGRGGGGHGRGDE